MSMYIECVYCNPVYSHTYSPSPSLSPSLPLPIISYIIGTFYGMVCAFCGVKTFDEALELCRRGDNSNVDLTVGDIYGGDYST